MKGGIIPDSEILRAVDSVLNDKKIRPLTDKVQVEAPTAVDFDIDIKYWIAQDDATEAAEIQTAVEKAVKDYALWQRSKLGRDINPTELQYRIRLAGAKRAEIISPAFTVVDAGCVAVAKNTTTNMEGLEDD